MNAAVRTLTLALAFSAAAPALAHAQSRARVGGRWLYGLSAGVGTRSARGTFLPADFPAGASQPRPRQTVLALDLDGGVMLASRLAVLGRLEQGGAFSNPPNGHWGTLGFHAVVRAWVMPRIWIEGGFGATQLGYSPPPQVSITTSRWWARTQDAAAGFALFQGPHIEMSLLGRYSTARFDGMRISKMSVQIGLTAR